MVKDSVAARKTQKADREKLRRDRLNEHFSELGNVLGEYTLVFIFLVVSLTQKLWMQLIAITCFPYLYV